MRKLITLLSLTVTVLTAQAGDYDYPTMSDPSGYNGKYAPVAAPVAIAPDESTVYQAGLFDQMTMIGNDILDPIATSAFISAVDNKQDTPLWTIGITGATHIKFITATNEAVYVAGTFADDITLGSKNGNTMELSGTTDSHESVNAFIAKYTSAGNLEVAQVIMPHKNSAHAGDESYYSDLSVEPTALQLFNGNVYLSFNYLGGYTTGDINVDGNLKSSYGLYDNRCCAVLSFSETDLTGARQWIDIRNASDVNEDGMCPQSICLTADEASLYVASFLSGDNRIDFPYKAESQTVALDHNENEQVYAAEIITIDKSGAYKCVSKKATPSSRAFVMNDIASMKVAGGELFIAGNVSTPLPFKDELVPDLWADQFAACLSTSDLSCKWASITGAKRDDMATTNDKYRKSIAADVKDGTLTVLGTTNFTCDATGTAPAYNGSTSLGLALSTSISAVTVKTDNGCKLSVTTSGNVGINAAAPVTDAGNHPCYDLSGRSIATPVKGQIFIKSNTKHIAR